MFDGAPSNLVWCIFQQCVDKAQSFNFNFNILKEVKKSIVGSIKLILFENALWFLEYFCNVWFGGKRLNYIEGGEILINLSILSLQTKEKILR